MSKSNLIAFSITWVMLLLGGVMVYLRTQPDGSIPSGKTVYVNVDRVFNEFDMKKELILELEESNRKTQVVIDSMAFALQKEADELNKLENPPQERLAAYEQRRDGYFKHKERAEESLKDLVARYDEQVISRLNGYIESFGRENEVDMILGNANNVLLYARSSMDVTDDLIAYVNLKYQGK